MNEPGIVGDLGPGDIGSLSVDASVHALASSTRHKWESIVQTLQCRNALGKSDVPDQLATTHTSSIGTWTSLDAGATSLRVCVE